MRTVVITQPTYLPWLGYFRLMKEADVFVFLDNVQFERRSWQCRNRIKCPRKPIWLTVPTLHENQCLIKDVTIDNTKPWQRKHWKSIKSCYGKAPHFNTYAAFFEEVYNRRWVKLASLNIYIIKYLASQLGLSPTFIRSSRLGVGAKRTPLLLNICEMLNADRYLSSIGAKQYMEEDGAKELFGKAGIAVEFFQFNHPVYPQLFGEFISELSVVDYLFNCGPDSRKVIFQEVSATFQPLS